MLVYLDTSAAAKLLVEEDGSAALSSHLDDRAETGDIVASALLETELRRMAHRTGVDQGAVTLLLDRVGLVLPDRRLYTEAGLLGSPHLRSLDALHLAAALRVGAGELVAYDTRLLGAAHALNLPTSSPA